MIEVCNPTFAKVDAILDLLTKSKSLHILLILYRTKEPLRFSQIKSAVKSSSTTVSRRLSELEDEKMIVKNYDDGMNITYELSNDGRSLAPVIEAIFEWCDNR